jgi:hypothetical protein
MLFGVAADDPAALAFAGLRPHEPSPALVEPPAQPSELSTLDEYRSWLIAALRIALDRRDETDEALIRFVVERSGVIVADPGWIEVRFPLDGVSIEIRRAGLDRDPGWVPWLGVVVKVLYV